jgi:hypothetical protein
VPFEGGVAGMPVQTGLTYGPVIAVPVVVAVVVPGIITAPQTPAIGRPRDASMVHEPAAPPQSASEQQYCAHWNIELAASIGTQCRPDPQNGPAMLSHIVQIFAVLGAGKQL